MASMRARFSFGIGVALLVVCLDQAAKLWVVVGLRLPELGKVELSPIFDLSFVQNFGVSFGLLRAGTGVERWGLIALSLAIAGFFLSWLRSVERGLPAAALGLVVGGAVGNVIDRIRYGYVVDFLDFRGLLFPWVFNVADAAITVGAGLLMLDFLLSKDVKETASTP